MKTNIMDKLQVPLMRISNWVGTNKILQAIKNSFIRTIPFTVIGSFANLIKMQLDALMKRQSLQDLQ